MATYTAPTEDMHYLINEFIDKSDIANIPEFEDFTPDIGDAIIEEVGKISEALLFPLNRSGDEQGCSYNKGKVTTPDGFKEAYQEVNEAGWGSLTCHPDFGGQGVPHYIANSVDEILISSNMSFSMYLGLTLGAYRVIETFASKEIKNKFLPAMVSGQWSGTMCLTEPHCGTDLGLIRSKAEPQADESYLISGSKIFISAGDHDLTENIIHLVLARTPDAPEGIKGISLFLVPKIMVNDDGTLGENNAVSCSGIEHKMGIKASSTCSIEFNNSRGYLIGEINKGMKAMFIMMNSARLHVGAQGLGLASASYQSALSYAKDRIQGRSLTGIKHPDKAADAIIVHPDVRRMLLTMKAYIEGSRALSTWLAVQLDIATHSPNQNKKQQADELISLLTPVFKAFLTDMGESVTSLGIQIYGGHGYIRENGMEQYLRDARICQIYEGTNGIQALDLVGRKLPAHMGRYCRHFFHPLANFIDENNQNEDMLDFIEPLSKAFNHLQAASLYIAQKGMTEPDEAATAATDYLRLFGLVALGYMWSKMAKQSIEKKGSMQNSFYYTKRMTGHFYMQRILPQTSALLSIITSGSESIMTFNKEQF